MADPRIHLLILEGGHLRVGLSSRVRPSILGTKIIRNAKSMSERELKFSVGACLQIIMESHYQQYGDNFDEKIVFEMAFEVLRELKTRDAYKAWEGDIPTRTFLDSKSDARKTKDIKRQGSIII